MKISDLFKGTKKDYFLYTLFGIGVAVAYSMVMVNWLGIVKAFVGDPALSYDRQPAFFKLLHTCLSYLLFLAAGILLIRGFLKKNLVQAVSMVFGFVLSYISLIMYLFLGPVIQDHLNRLPFDPIKWQNELADSKNPVKIRMVDDLLRNHPLVGKSKQEINALLGVPPKTGYFNEFDYVYWLGPERGFLSIDSEWLAIKFNDDIVIEARIMRD